MNSAQERIEHIKRLGKEKDVFYFKKFRVKDDKSTMRVGTDAVLLGISVETGKSSNILEIGSGCGIISLILCQRSSAFIDALEVDYDSVIQARSNFEASLWTDRVRVIHSSFQDYRHQSTFKYDLIVSNPPFFSRSFKSLTERRNLSRHDDRLDFQDLLENSHPMLTDEGNLWIILPVREAVSFNRLAGLSGFHLHHSKSIIPREGKEANRIIMCFGKDKAMFTQKSSLTLRDSEGEFSNEFKSFAHDFYIDF